MNTFVVLSLLVASALAIPAPEFQSANLDCLGLDENMLSCFAIKANSAISRAARSSSFELFPGVTFNRDTPLERSGKALESETDLMNALPRENADRALKLAAMIYDSAVSFFKSHSLKINVPEQSISRALTEGRAKIKKFALPLIAAAGFKIFALIPILLGGLGLLVLKALVVGKVALLIAATLAFQKLFGSGSIGSGVGNIFSKATYPAQPPAPYYDAPGSSNSWAPNVATGNSGYQYKRSFDDEKIAQKLAFSAHVPDNE
ncbi:uncharacterized protein LOC123271891 [Cotesia glomerata]|uniref:Uncharacterized protein n=1 Tax=Cotesia glomerata TaxID=32391 RepID=A0AAV7ICK8_COTGL|nr:uncharacterized protein LOC123271891 [Cotesia glomerata]KAH0557713.1 hypothetical protein KQX54_010640 [Cotesia glomerata]